MAEDGEKGYKLDKLLEYVGDNPETIRDMVSLFLQSAEEMKIQMLEACHQNNPEVVGKLAHKLKPSLDIFGVHNLAVQVRILEKIQHDKEMCLNIHTVVAAFLKNLDVVVRELRADYPPTP